MFVAGVLLGAPHRVNELALAVQGPEVTPDGTYRPAFVVIDPESRARVLVRVEVLADA